MAATFIALQKMGDLSSRPAGRLIKTVK